MPYADPRSPTARSHANARQRRWKATPKGKAVVHRYNTSKKGRAANQRYAGTLGYAVAQSRYQRRVRLEEAQRALENLK